MLLSNVIGMLIMILLGPRGRRMKRRPQSIALGIGRRPSWPRSQVCEDAPTASLHLLEVGRTYLSTVILTEKKHGN